MDNFTKHLLSYVSANKNEFVSYVNKMYGQKYSIQEVKDNIKELKFENNKIQEEKYEDKLRLRAETIQDFANSKSFYLTQEILSLVRNNLSEPSEYNVEMMKEKMILLDNISNYEMQDIVWDWIEEYYGYYEEENIEEEENK